MVAAARLPTSPRCGGARARRRQPRQEEGRNVAAAAVAAAGAGAGAGAGVSRGRRARSGFCWTACARTRMTRRWRQRVHHDRRALDDAPREASTSAADAMLGTARTEHCYLWRYSGTLAPCCRRTAPAPCAASNRSNRSRRRRKRLYAIKAKASGADMDHVGAMSHGGSSASVLEQLLQVSSMHKDDTELLVQVSLPRSVGQPCRPLLRHLPIGAVSESASTPVAASSPANMLA